MPNHAKPASFVSFMDKERPELPLGVYKRSLILLLIMILWSATMAVFLKGDEVEVCSKEDGFLGSYFEATVISQLDDNTRYMVQYKNLVEEEDQTRPLVEIVSADEVRPVPPRTVAEATQVFHYLQRVDAFDNDGWWVGNISGKQGSKYWVYFDSTGEEIAYPVSQLRNHLEWCNGKWVFSEERSF